MSIVKDTNDSCGFCKPEVKETQEILRTKYSRLIYPLAPTIFENVMVIPIRHVSTIEELTSEEIVDILSWSKECMPILLSFITQQHITFLLTMGQHQVNMNHTYISTSLEGLRMRR